MLNFHVPKTKLFFQYDKITVWHTKCCQKSLAFGVQFQSADQFTLKK
jgi:hypothetical protein